MAVPDFQTLMLPVLQKADRGEVKISSIIEELSNDFSLTESERSELLPSGKQAIMANRVHWAKTYLKQAGLVASTRRGHFQITEKGKSLLAGKPDRINISTLRQFPEFVGFHERVNARPRQSSGTSPDHQSQSPGEEPLTPEESIRTAHAKLNGALGEEILDRVLIAQPAFFERLIIALLLAMGYGGSVQAAGRAIGRSGDDGIDGVIDQDALGLDRVYIQAKRYKRDNSVGASAIREFFGSLNMHKASKGLFVTTSQFSKSAIDTAERLGSRIVLVDGVMLVNLMIRHSVGCRVEESLEIKRIDEDFFE